MRKLRVWIITTIIPRLPIGARHILKMVASVHYSGRYGDVVCIITYHLDEPTVGHHVFLVNVEKTVSVTLFLIDAEVMKFSQCIYECYYFRD